MSMGEDGRRRGVLTAGFGLKITQIENCEDTDQELDRSRGLIINRLIGGYHGGFENEKIKRRGNGSGLVRSCG